MNPHSFNPRTPCGVRHDTIVSYSASTLFQSTHSLRSATCPGMPSRGASASFNPRTPCGVRQGSCACPHGTDSFNPRTPCGVRHCINVNVNVPCGFNPRTPCGVRHLSTGCGGQKRQFQSTHSLRSATAPNLIHCYSTKQIILCANLPKKTVIARLLFLSIYLSIFYSQCITPIADLPGNSCELEVGAQAMFNSL